MHELSFVQAIANVVLNHAENNHVKKVVGVTIKIGELHDFEQEWMQKYFDKFARDTVAEGAQLNLVIIPIQFKCQECSKFFTMSRGDFIKMNKLSCLDCGSARINLYSGKEYSIEGIEVMQ